MLWEQSFITGRSRGASQVKLYPYNKGGMEKGLAILKGEPPKVSDSLNAGA